jgi:succinate dehydrogenase/fumarate reductase flavoprotein subunit
MAICLKRGLELLDWLQEDLEHVGAEDYHQLMRAWELKHRALTSQCVTEHTLFRERNSLAWILLQRGPHETGR